MTENDKLISQQVSDSEESHENQNHQKKRSHHDVNSSSSTVSAPASTPKITSTTRHSSPMIEDIQYSVMVRRGASMPKKLTETKVHPTYETTITIENVQKQHKVLHFFQTYRGLATDLQNMGVGHNLTYHIDCEFPPTYVWSAFGFQLSNNRLQKRCEMLEKWMQALFRKFHKLPIPVQIVISDFLSLYDGDEEKENNKNEILTMLKNRKTLKKKHSRSKSKSSTKARRKSEGSPDTWNSTITTSTNDLTFTLIEEEELARGEGGVERDEEQPSPITVNE